jgi:GT2 family glycosyltransferase
VDLSVIIVNWNTADLTRRCLETLSDALPAELSAEILVVDNASTDGSAEMVAREFPSVILLRRSENGGFARANNEALARAGGEYAYLLNSDTVSLPGSIERLVAHLQRETMCGVAAPRLLNEDLTLQPSCWRFPRWDTAALESLYLYRLLPRRWRGELLLAGYWDHERARPVDWVMGAAMLVRRAVLTQVGGLSERYFMFGEDLEWCWRIRRAGWRIDYRPEASVIHLRGRSSQSYFGDSEASAKQRAYYQFCDEHLGRTETTVVRGINAAGALLRIGVVALRGTLRPDGEARAALRMYQTSLRASLRAE